MKTKKVLVLLIFFFSIYNINLLDVSAKEASNGIILTDKNFTVIISELYSESVYFSWSYPTGLEGSTYVKLVEGNRTFGALRTKEKALGFGTLKASTEYTAYFTYINDKGSSTVYKLTFTTKKVGNEEIIHDYIDLKGTVIKEGAKLSWKNDKRMDSYLIYRDNVQIAEVSGNTSSYIDPYYMNSDRTEYNIEAYLDGRYMGNDFFIYSFIDAKYEIEVKGVSVTFSIKLNYWISEYHVYINNKHYVIKLSKDKSYYNLYERNSSNEQIKGTYYVNEGNLKITINDLLPYTNFPYSIEFLESPNSKVNYALTNGTGEITTTNDIIDHWASSSITTLIEMNVMKGYNNGLFMPNNKITRAEFIKAFLGVSNIEPKYNEANYSFKDIKTDSWFTPYIITAIDHKLIFDSDYFNPNNFISRQEIATIVNRLLQISSVPSETLVDYIDVDTISPWASNAMSAMVQANIMSGDQQRKLNPTSYATRAETATILVNIMKSLN